MLIGDELPLTESNLLSGEKVVFTLGTRSNVEKDSHFALILTLKRRCTTEKDEKECIILFKFIYRAVHGIPSSGHVVVCGCQRNSLDCRQFLGIVKGTEAQSSAPQLKVILSLLVD